MEWIMLLIAAVLEVTWAVFMKMSEGFTRMLPSVITAVGYIASAVFLALAMRKLPLGTAYAIRDHGDYYSRRAAVQGEHEPCAGRLRAYDRRRDHRA